MTVYYKMRQISLRNATATLLKNAPVLLQNVTVIRKCSDFITKNDSYYIIQLLLQIAKVQRAF